MLTFVLIWKSEMFHTHTLVLKTFARYTVYTQDTVYPKGVKTSALSCTAISGSDLRMVVLYAFLQLFLIRQCVQHLH